jgi:hypothetical protein
MKKLIFVLTLFLFGMFGYTLGEVVISNNLYAEEQPIIEPGILWDYSGSGPIICECPKKTYNCFCILPEGM